MNEIKLLKFNEPHKFKKNANDDQLRFNQKLSETLDSAKSAAKNSQLENIKNDLEEGEKLISERQKHILLAVKSDYAWAPLSALVSPLTQKKCRILQTHAWIRILSSSVQLDISRVTATNERDIELNTRR